MDEFERLELACNEWADAASKVQQEGEDELFARRVERNARFAKVMELSEESEAFWPNLARLNSVCRRLSDKWRE
jgi:hypothetical protein